MNIFLNEYIELEKSTATSDPLSLDYIAQQMSYWILPNITSRNNRARYYPMVCFGIYLIEDILKDNYYVTDDDVKRYYIRYEKIWAYSVCKYYSSIGKSLSGIEKVMLGKQGIEKACNKNIIKLDDIKLLTRQLDLGSLGAYRSSLVKSGFIREDSLKLTDLGIRLAKSFIHCGEVRIRQFEEYVKGMIQSGKINFQVSNIKLENLGYYLRLDYKESLNDSYYKQYINSEEANLISRYLIETNERMKVTCGFLKDTENLNYISEIIESISKASSKNISERNIIDDFKTMLPFEELSIGILNMFKDIQYELTQNGAEMLLSDIVGKISAEDIPNLVKNLKISPNYNKLYDMNYSKEFLNLINSIEGTSDSLIIIHEMIKCHRDIHKRRGKAVIIEERGGKLILSLDNALFQKEKVTYHDYKINNVYNIIKDLR